MSGENSHTAAKANLGANPAQRVMSYFRDRRAQKEEAGSWLDRYASSGPVIYPSKH